MCINCYNPKDHIGHNVISRVGNFHEHEFCGCGYEEAWSNNLHCKYHNTENYTNEPPTPEFEDSIRETIEIALDYVIDVFSTSDFSIGNFNNTNQLDELNRVSCLSENVYGYDNYASSEYALVIWKSQKKTLLSISEVCQNYLVIASEFSRIVAQNVSANGRTRLVVSKTASNLISLKRRLNANGYKSTVHSLKDNFKEEMCGCIIRWVEDISKARLRNNFLILRKIISDTLLSPWRVGNASLRGEQPLVDRNIIPPICTSLFGTHIPTADVYFSAFGDVNFDDLSRPAASLFWQSHESISIDLRLKQVRVQYLIFFEIRFWACLRESLKNIYIAVLLPDPESKLSLGHYYFAIYPQIAQIQSIFEEEFDHSVFSAFSANLFDTPVVSSSVCLPGYFSGLMISLVDLFTKYPKLSSRDIELFDTGKTSRTDGKMLAVLKDLKYDQFLYNVNVVLCQNVNKAAIAGDSRNIFRLCDVLLPFQGALTFKKGAGNDTLFTDLDLNRFIHCVSLVLRVASSAIFGISHCTTEETKQGIRYISWFIHDWILGRRKDLTNEHAFQIIITQKTIKFGSFSRTLHVNNSRIESMPVSLYHPLHVLLSWFIQFGPLKSAQELRNCLLVSFYKASGTFNSTLLFFLFDYPMRTLATISQIQSGFWSSNGQGLTTMTFNYRGSSFDTKNSLIIGERSFDRDLFMNQVALVTLDPSHAFLRFVQVWGIFDTTVSYQMRDDEKVNYFNCFLHYLIAFITERCQLLGLSNEESTRKYISKEIIQYLAFGPRSYPDICKIIPTSLTSDQQFNTILSEMCEYEPPINKQHQGVYKLKEEYYKFLDTKYFSFCLSEIYNAEQLVKKQISKVENIPEHLAVVLPYLEPIENKMFKNIAAFTCTTAFANFFHHMLISILNSEIKSDSVLLLLLSLGITAALDNLSQPAHRSSSFVAVMTENIVDDESDTAWNKNVVCVLFHLYRNPEFELFKPTVHKLICLMREKSPRKVENALKGPFGDVSLELDCPSFSPIKVAKKAKSIDKSKRLLNRLKKQHQLFAVRNPPKEDYDLSEEEEDPNTIQAIKKDIRENNCVLCHMHCDEKKPFGIPVLANISNTHRTVPFDKPDWVLAAYGLEMTEAHTFISKNYKFSNEWVSYVNEEEVKNPLGPGFPIQDIILSPVLNSCYHRMHIDCYKSYISDSSNRIYNKESGAGVSIKEDEVICPFCKRFCNAILPICHNAYPKLKCLEFAVDCSFDDFLQKVTSGKLEALATEYSTNLSLDMAKSKMVFPLYASLFEDGNESEEAILLVDMIDDLMVRMAATRNQVPSLRSPPGFDDYYVLYHTLSGTIHNMELSMRDLDHSLMFFNHIPAVEMDFLHSLMEYSSFYTSLHVCFRMPQTEKANLWKNLELFSGNDFAFNQLVASYFLLPQVYGLERQQLIIFFFLKELARVIHRIVYAFERNEKWTRHSKLLLIPILKSTSKSRVNLLKKAITSLYEGLEGFDQPVILSKFATMGEVIYTIITKSIMPFMRKAGLLVYSQTYDSSDPVKYKRGRKLEIDSFCEFLAVPQFPELLKLLSNKEIGYHKVCRTVLEMSKTSHTKLSYPALQRLLKIPSSLGKLRSALIKKGYRAGFGGEEGSTRRSRRHRFEMALCMFCSETIRVRKLSLKSPDHSYAKHVARCHTTCGIFLLLDSDRIVTWSPFARLHVNSPYSGFYRGYRDLSNSLSTRYIETDRVNEVCRRYWFRNGVVDCTLDEGIVENGT